MHFGKRVFQCSLMITVNGHSSTWEIIHMPAIILGLDLEKGTVRPACVKPPADLRARISDGRRRGALVNYPARSKSDSDLCFGGAAKMESGSRC